MTAISTEIALQRGNEGLRGQTISKGIAPSLVLEARERGAPDGESGARGGIEAASAVLARKVRCEKVCHASRDGTLMRELHSDESPRQSSEDCASEKRSRVAVARERLSVASTCTCTVTGLTNESSVQSMYM